MQHNVTVHMTNNPTTALIEMFGEPVTA